MKLGTAVFITLAISTLSLNCSYQTTLNKVDLGKTPTRFEKMVLGIDSSTGPGRQVDSVAVIVEVGSYFKTRDRDLHSMVSGLTEDIQQKLKAREIPHKFYFSRNDSELPSHKYIVSVIYYEDTYSVIQPLTTEEKQEQVVRNIVTQGPVLGLLRPIPFFTSRQDRRYYFFIISLDERRHSSQQVVYDSLQLAEYVSTLKKTH